MAEYIHGAYGSIEMGGSAITDMGGNTMVYVGTAPVHQVKGGAEYVNKPIIVKSLAEAKAKFGYASDWEHFTLCEVMHQHFAAQNAGAAIFINVFPGEGNGSQKSATATPVSGIAKAVVTDEVAIDTVAVTGKDAEAYTATFDSDSKTITIRENTKGALGTGSITITYKAVDVSAIDAELVIGAPADKVSAAGNTGLYVLRDIYKMTGNVPSFLCVPGFSGIPEVHDAMCEISQKVNGHWDMIVISDIPLNDGENDITILNANTWKEAHGYNKPFEKVLFPQAELTDGKAVHLSTIWAVNQMVAIATADGIPFVTASNTECPTIKGLKFAFGTIGIDDEDINEYLNKHGIASAIYAAGTWRLWGSHAANYEFGGENKTAFDTQYQMLYYISNDFQTRRAADIDKPMTLNDLRSIVSEEQARLAALISIGALTYGAVEMDNERMEFTDVIEGDFKFAFRITTTPLAKSLTANVSWTDEGFKSYFADFTAGNE